MWRWLTDFVYRRRFPRLIDAYHCHRCGVVQPGTATSLCVYCHLEMVSLAQIIQWQKEHIERLSQRLHEHEQPKQKVIPLRKPWDALAVRAKKLL